MNGRQLLREVLAAPLRFTPEGEAYRFVGSVTTGQLVAGAVAVVNAPQVKTPCVASPAGFEGEWKRLSRWIAAA